ncbi:low temperature requirement protein A [Solirubrobacter phytolaccae]|uniref:Low temperature requirement protein A n=1 Tax=Solirubrobacter phytolaccae TaxID=1404360 RepID=A0A9X3N9V5_9ACTN|nr:hypothetical protein [Solirubrobacter phytolaccae]MDA0182071.1 low temperature requirement protein A [Solirubrobacter phytolaccae]
MGRALPRPRGGDHGDDDRPEHLLFLAGSIPIGVAAVAIEPAAHGDPAVFAGALAAVRVLLALAHGGARREHRLAAFAPKDPREALDPHHFAERFGLF